MHTIAELQTALTTNRHHLADCESHRLSPHLQELHDAWSGEPQVDFDYLASVIRYSIEEDEDCLWKAKRVTATSSC